MVPVPEKSTTVRSSARRAPGPVRLGFRLLSLVAPRVADRRAARLFRTPRRPRRSSAPRVPGLVAEPGTTFSQGLGLPTWTFGAGARVALLVHGWNGHAGQMARLVAPLVERGFRVVAFDQPAHGAADGEEATVIDFARAIADVARVHGADVVVAHSLGATATALAIAQHGLSPAAVVLYAPAAAVPPYLRRMAEALELPEERVEGLFASVTERLGVDLDTLDVRTLARGFRTPALVLHDPEDDDVAFAEGRAIAEAWPGARLLALPGIGHRDGLRDPQVVATAADFVAEVV